MIGNRSVLRDSLENMMECCKAVRIDEEVESIESGGDHRLTASNPFENEIWSPTGCEVTPEAIGNDTMEGRTA